MIDNSFSKLRTILNPKGFTLTEALITLGIMRIAAAAFTSLYKQQIDSQMHLLQKSEMSDLQSTTNQVIADPDTCLCNFEGIRLNPSEPVILDSIAGACGEGAPLLVRVRQPLSGSSQGLQAKRILLYAQDTDNPRKFLSRLVVEVENGHRPTELKPITVFRILFTNQENQVIGCASSSDVISCDWDGWIAPTLSNTSGECATLQYRCSGGKIVEMSVNPEHSGCAQVTKPFQ